MGVEWTGVGPDLLVALDRAAGPLGHQLQEHLRTAIRRGDLPPGERLPSSRRLAEQLGVSRGLVVETYEQLYAEGYLVTAVGSGTRVAPNLAVDDRAATADRPASSAPRPAASPADVVVDFEYGIPDLVSAPVRDWSWAVAEAARTAPSALMGDENDGGVQRLREVLAGYHRRVRAGCARADDVVVTGGFRNALALVLAHLCDLGVTGIGLESPGPREHDLIARRTGLRAVPLPVDEEGVDVAALRRADVRAVLLTPAHQCPTGVALSPARRQALVDWAHDVDGYVLEDDYDAEFRYDRQPVGSLQGLASDRVFALGSVSKTLAPGIRVGWVLAPPRHVAGVVREKRLTSRGVPSLDQLALAVLVESGRYDRHLRRMREVYRARRDALDQAVARHLPGLRLGGLEAGCHAVLWLPDDVVEADVVEAAARRGVLARGVGDYRFEDPAPGKGPAGAGLVLGFGNVSESRIERGVRVLAEVL